MCLVRTEDVTGGRLLFYHFLTQGERKGCILIGAMNKASRKNRTMLHSGLHVALLAVLLSSGAPARLSQPSNNVVSQGTKADDDKPLFLTPLIEARRIDEALQRSRVRLFKECCDVNGAYSGYITVNKSTGSNLFFLYVSAQAKSKSLPLILWLDGGPGQSSLLGQFFSNGPVGIARDGSFYKRQYTLTDFANVIYLDEPVGAGFSFTQKESGYPNTLEDMADDIYEFLRQFLLLFPVYQGRSFYVSGESYGARPAIATGVKFHKALQERNRVRLDFNGVTCGVGFLAPLVAQLNSTEFLYRVGLLDQKGRKIFAKVFQNMEEACKTKNVTALAYIRSKVLWVSKDASNPTLFTNLTGYQYDGNALQSTTPMEKLQFRQLMENRDFKKSIHVGVNPQFRKQDLIITQNLVSDFLRDISVELITLLDNYRVLMYVGGLDIIIPAANTDDFIRNLCWRGKSGFNDAPRVPWSASGQGSSVSGYITQAGTFWYVHLLRSGHYPFFDQNEAAYKMMRAFLEGNQSLSLLNHK